MTTPRWSTGGNLALPAPLHLPAGENLSRCGVPVGDVCVECAALARPLDDLEALLRIEPYETECSVRDDAKGDTPAGSSMTRAEWDRRYLLDRLRSIRHRYREALR